MSSAEETTTKQVKLPYFHRVLSEEDKALIGDITPKPVTNANGTSTQDNGSAKQASAWNAAQTWEERDYTKWGKDKVKELFEPQTVSKSYSGSNFTITKFDSLQGNASITHSRGKARYLYEWGFSLDFESQNAAGTLIGTATVHDAINDQLDDIDVQISWTTKGLQSIVMKQQVAAVKALVVDKMKEFENEFKSQ